VCTACLGTLQYADDDATTIQPILAQLEAEQYETTSFALTLTLPLSLIHREKLLKVHIQDQLAQNTVYQAQNKTYAWSPDIVREAKDPIRSIVAQRLALASGLTSDVHSKFHITMCLAHTATETEHLFLTQVKDPVLRIRKVKKRVRNKRHGG
jgi:tRNA pseudouridine synthase 10